MQCYLDFYFIRDVTRFLELLLEVFILPLVVPAVGDGLARYLGVGYPRILPLRHPIVVVNEEYSAVSVHPLLPSLGQGTEVIMVPPVGDIALTRQGGGPTVPGIHPGCLLADVVNEEHAAIRCDLHRPPCGQSLGVERLGGQLLLPR